MRDKDFRLHPDTLCKCQPYDSVTISRCQRFDLDMARGRLTQAVSALAFCVSPDELIAKTRRTAHIAFARQAAMYLAHIAYGLSLSRVGRIFGRDRSTASHACHLMEDLRDDPAVDARFDLLESYLRSAPDMGTAKEAGLVHHD